jgi:hypothetical protein
VCSYNHKTGEWAHTTRLTRFPERLWLSNFSLTSTSTIAASTTAAQPSSTVQHTLATSWNGASLATVFAQVFEAAEREVAKLTTTATTATDAAAKRETAPVDFFGESEAPVASEVSHESAGIARYDHLRWYLLPSDVQSSTGTGRLLDLRGPIHPELFGQSSLTTATPTATAAVELTAYAATRDRKLASRTGREDHVPRFLRLLQDADGQESLLFSLKLHNIRLRGTQDRQSAATTASTSAAATAVAAPAAVSNATVTTAAKAAAPAKNKAATQAILAEAFATATTTTATTATTGDDDDCVACSLTADCSTGECTLRGKCFLRSLCLSLSFLHC